jgi:hypothetical protein
MLGCIETAGERLLVDCEPGWVARLVRECAGEALRPGRDGWTVAVRIEAGHAPFDVRGWEPLTRGAWRHGTEVVIEDAATSGFDLGLEWAEGRPSFRYRWRPPSRDRAAAWGLRSRFHLLARAVLVQYPALWWAGVRGRVPLHAAACTAGDAVPLLAGPGGVGKSTLLLGELRRGGRATSDNVCVSDGAAAWGLVEPLRLLDGSGRRMPHGRREEPMPNRVPGLVPDRVVVIRRGSGPRPEVRPCDPRTALRSLVAGTEMAGELMRYRPFAATLAAGTGMGPAQPPLVEVASALARRLPCLEVTLSDRPGARLAELVQDVQARAWTGR